MPFREWARGVHAPSYSSPAGNRSNARSNGQRPVSRSEQLWRCMLHPPPTPTVTAPSPAAARACISRHLLQLISVRGRGSGRGQRRANRVAPPGDGRERELSRGASLAGCSAGRREESVDDRSTCKHIPISCRNSGPTDHNSPERRRPRLYPCTRFRTHSYGRRRRQGSGPAPRGGPRSPTERREPLQPPVRHQHREAGSCNPGERWPQRRAAQGHQGISAMRQILRADWRAGQHA